LRSGRNFTNGEGDCYPTMSGALTGNWSYDATKKQLKLGNVMVCVEREVDWEATPRCVTLVYAGTEKNLNATYWGKKVK